MGRAVAGREWERHNASLAEEARRKREAEKEAKLSEVRAQAGGFRSFTSSDLMLSSNGSGQSPPASPIYIRREVDVPELEANRYSSPFHMPYDVPTPPLSASFGQSFPNDEDESISELKAEIANQGVEIRRLSTELASEKRKIQQLQTQRHVAVEAQKQAILSGDRQKVADLETKVADLVRLLGLSTDREMVLESQLSEGRLREQELKDQLHRGWSKVRELEADADESRDQSRGMRQRLERVQGELEDVIGNTVLRQQELHRQMAEVMRSQTRAEEPTDSLQSTTHSNINVSGRSRRHARQMEERGFVSMPKRDGSRRFISF
ncbi:hypothetical protein MMC28_006689 [Mycoblastus sanguinarius]|nr:hypothetical protein [Mycoblastus sanguinarius]